MMGEKTQKEIKYSKDTDATAEITSCGEKLFLRSTNQNSIQ